MKRYLVALMVLMNLFVHAQIKKANTNNIKSQQEKLVEKFKIKGFTYQINLRELNSKELSVYDATEGSLYIVYLLYKGSKIEKEHFPKLALKEDVRSKENKICRESSYEITANTLKVYKKTFDYYYPSEEIIVYSGNKYGQLEISSEKILHLNTNNFSDKYLKEEGLKEPAFK